MTREEERLRAAGQRTAHWRRWGPYLADRQWGTVREDYSAHGTAWDYFPHDHARSRAYRWGEDGLAALVLDQLDLAVRHDVQPVATIACSEDGLARLEVLAPDAR